MTEKTSERDTHEAATKSPKRARGASFPTMPLGEAVAIIKKIANYGTTHTNEAVASLLGHTTANSGPYRTKVAALKDFGLLTGRGDDLTVTPLALELTHPGLDANPQTSLAAAFRSCKLFSTVYDALPRGRELDVDALANSALHNYGVATQAKKSFATSFVKSGETAGLLVSVEGGKIRLPDQGGAAMTEYVQDEPDQAPAVKSSPDQAPVVKPPSGKEPGASVFAAAVVNHSWPIDGGTIHFIVESSRPLPAAAYSVIGAVIGAGDKLAVMLGPQEVAVENDGDPE